MRRIARISALSILTCISATAAPFLAVGDNAELFVTASAAVQFDNNIYLDTSDKKHDTIYSFTPGLDLVFGKGSATSGNLYYREEIRRYSDKEVQDTELSSVGLNTAYGTGVTTASFNASYAQTAQNDNDVNPIGSIVRRKLTNVGGKAEFEVSPKTKFSLGLTCNRTEYGGTGYTDSDIWTFPLDIYWVATPKLDWSLGYQYRKSELSGTGSDSGDHFFNVGARGEFTPKLTGQLRMGYSRRSFKADNDKGLLGLGSSFTYVYSDKTSCQLSLSNDFGTSGTGASTRNFSWGLGSNTHFTEQWNMSLGVNFRTVDYSSRKDSFTESQIGMSYVYNTMVSFSASYTHRINSSKLASAEFTNNVFSLGANIRY